MTSRATEAHVREALLELQRYFSDQLAPLMVMHSVEMLLKLPPEIVAREIHGWVETQFSGRPGVTVSDCVYHAVKKIHLMSEFDLVSQDKMQAYINELGAILMAACPAEERENLRTNIGRIGQAEAAGSATPVEFLHRQTGRVAAVDPAVHAPEVSATAAPGAVVAPRAAASTGAPAAISEQDVSRGLMRFGLLVDRLQGCAAPAGGGSEASVQRMELVDQALTAAAVSSRSGDELEKLLGRLQVMGVEAKLNQIFRSLSRSLPAWTVPDAVLAAGTEADQRPHRAIDAMHRIITTADSAEDSAERFNEMTQVAIEQFNDGSLEQARKMFELALRIVEDDWLSPEVTGSLRRRAHESLSEEQLRRFADAPDKHDSLRKVLTFFPGLSVENMLDELSEEERRERRKLLLALLQVHGAPARKAAMERLKTYGVDDSADPHGYFTRNLVFLLRFIPRETDAPCKREMDYLTTLSGDGWSIIVIKETIAALGHVKTDAAAKVLTKRLRSLEQRLIRDDVEPYGEAELRGLVDRAVQALIGIETPNALREVVRHAFTRHDALGDTLTRLEKLGTIDLDFDKKLVAHLVETLRQELPSKVLGFVVQKKIETAIRLVRAVSGTPSPIVRTVLNEIVRRFPGQVIEKEASKVLATFGSGSRPAVESNVRSLSGDVELFGLPSLFQTLADSKLTGVLSLTDLNGETVGTLGLEAGGVTACQVGHLQGVIAFYQLFEKPVPGTFNFNSVADTAPEEASKENRIEVLPAILEALRRHDEFQHARVLIPDDCSLAATGDKPTPASDEADPALMKTVWQRAASGATPTACETEIAVDSYRIRRLYAHWVEEGALTLRVVG